MADFTVEGIIDVDASRGIREIKKFKKELGGLLAELKAVGREINELDGRTIDIGVDADLEEITRLRQELERIADENVDINIDTDFDSSKLAGDFAEIQAALRAFDDADITVGAELEGVLDDLEQLRHQVEALKAIGIDVDLEGWEDTIAEARRLRASVDAAMKPDPDIDVDVDDHGSFQRLKDSMEGVVGSAGGGVGLAGIIAAVGVLTALMGPLTGALAGLAGAGISGLAVLTTGLGSFAAFAIPTFKDIGDAIKLFNTDVSSLDEDQLKAFNEEMRRMKKEEPGIYALGDAFSDLKENYMDVVDQMKPEVIRMTGEAFGFLNSLIEQTGPIALAAAPAITDLISRAEKGIRGDSWEAFFTYVEEKIPSFIEGFGTFVGNILTGVANLVVALDPLTTQLGGWFRNMGEDFREWSETLATNQEFQEFMGFIQKTGPKVWDILVSLGEAIGNIVLAMAPLAGPILDFIQDFLDWFNAMAEGNPKVVQLAFAIGVLAAIVVPMIGPLATFVTTIAGVVGAVGGAPLAIGALALAIAGLVVSIALFTETGERHDELWNQLETTWHAIESALDDVIAVVEELWGWLEKSGAIEQWQQAFERLGGALQALLPLLGGAVLIALAPLLAIFIALGYAINAVAFIIEGLAKIVGAVVGAIYDFFAWLYNKLVGNSIIPDMVNAIIEWFGKLPGAIWGMLVNLKDKVVAGFTFIKEKAIEKTAQLILWLKEKWSELKNWIGEKVTAIKEDVGNRFTALKEKVKAVITDLPGWIREKFEQIKNFIKEKVEAAKNALVEKFQEMKEKAREKVLAAKDAILGVFSNAADWLFDAGKDIVQGLIDGIGDMVGGVQDALGAITDMVPDWKGPEDVDKKLLQPSGKWIMEGLIVGIDSKTNDLFRQLDGITDAIKGQPLNIGDVGGSAMFSDALAGLNSGTAPVTNYNDIHVAVPVGANMTQAGRELVEAIETYGGNGGRPSLSIMKR